MTDRVNRRRIVSGIGVAVTASLAGCNGTGSNTDGGNGTDSSGTESGNSTDSSGGDNGGTLEDFPDGFSENGVSDFETAFEEGSAYRSQSHIQIEGESVEMTEDQTDTVIYSEQIDAEAQRRIIAQETADGESSLTRYFTEDMLYTREVQGGRDPQYEVQENEFTRITDVTFEIEDHVAGEVEFESERTEQGLIRFTATKDRTDVVLVIDEAGLPQRFSTRSENEGYSEELTLSFSYEEITIEEPEWVSEAES